MGRVELGEDATRWVAEQARQIDYWITAADTPAEIMAALPTAQLAGRHGGHLPDRQ